MIGYVDEWLRALLEVRVRRLPSDEPDGVTVWIDTAFNGHLLQIDYTEKRVSVV